MKIGFFGDSYVDVFACNPFDQQRSWTFKLLQEFDSPVISTGHGGTSQFHAILEWKKFLQSEQKIDVAVWTFTWDNRLYSQYPVNQMIFSAVAEQRHEYVRQDFVNRNIILNPDDPDMIDNLVSANEYYLRYISNDYYNQFVHSLMCKWVLELPEQHPDIKFIFIPNTELSNTVCKQFFQSGVLLDFAFETLSNLEPESPGPMPINCGRVGHLNNRNIDLVKNFVKEIILNYDTYQNSVHKVDYNKFDIKH